MVSSKAGDGRDPAEADAEWPSEKAASDPGSVPGAGGSRDLRDLLRWGARGVVGGLIATVGMTVYRAPVSRTLPPSAEFWARYVAGGEPGDHPGPALGLHLLYGASAGAAFGALFGALGGGSVRDLPREAAGIALGTVYGAALSVFGTRVMLKRVLDMELDVVEAVVFHGGHLVYGLTLGTWIGTRELATDVDFEEADDRREHPASPRR
jgi:hypothetical protein